MLIKGRLSVSVLDATAVTVSLLRRDFDTASSVMFMLRLGELLEDVVSKLPAGNRDYNLLAIERIMPELITSTRAKTLDTLALVQKSEQTEE